MTKKKTSKVVKLKEADKKTHLSEIEMLKMENNNLKVLVLETRAALADKVAKLNSLMVEKQSLEILSELNKAKESRKDYNNIIKDELGLESDKWGYDPLTGEVKE